MPPSTRRTCPVIYPASGEQRKQIAAATSSVLPKRPNGVELRMKSRRCSDSEAVKSVGMNPGRLHWRENLGLAFYPPDLGANPLMAAFVAHKFAWPLEPRNQGKFNGLI